MGGLGLSPAANIGQDFALFEPVHGAAFDIANKNIANPSSIFLSIKLMFEWLSERYERNYAELKMMANHIENVLVELLRENIKTKDIGGRLHTNEFTKEFLRRMF